jgi:hypothetical protein
LSTRTLALLLILLLLIGAALLLRSVVSESDSDSQAAPQSSARGEPYAHAPAEVAQPEHPRINDAAHILGPFTGKLGRMADSFHDDLGVDVHVVTTNETAQSIESLSTEVFQQRKIGVGAPTGGLLVLLDPKLASARIEVGYSLEHALTDLHMGRIARDQLAPYTSYGAAGMAVMDVLHYLRDQVYLSAALGDLTLSADFQKNPEYVEYQTFVSGGAGAKAKLTTEPLDADLKRAVPADKRARYAPSANAQESVEAFLRASAELAGDPTLELFTEGSRMMRTYYPFARFEELQRFERIQSSFPLEVVQHDDHAVATSKQPAKGFVPILLHREQGLWRIDLVETWKNLFFDNTGNYFLRNSNTPYAFGLQQFGEGRYYDIAALPLGTGSIADDIASLDGKHDALSALRRAELWLRNGFVFPQAYLAYEEARAAAPKDPLVLQTLGDRALYLGFPEIAIPLLEPIGRGVEMSLVGAYNDMGDTMGANRWVSSALAENPYDLPALQWQQFLAEREQRSEDARRAKEQIATLSSDPMDVANPIVLSFDPKGPKFDSQTTLDVNGTKVFDHSHFGVAMRNTSKRDVEIESVMLASVGTAAASGLGDIKNYWRYPAGGNRLRAGEGISFERPWGFTVETGHQHVRYVFRTCWHGVGTTVRQCRTQWVDTMP